MPAGDRCVLDWVLARVRESLTFGPRAHGLPSRNAVLLATTDRHADDPLAAWGEAAGLEVYRDAGDPDDEAGRLARTALASGASWCVPIGGDTPFVDPSRLDAAARAATPELDCVHFEEPAIDPSGLAPPAWRTEALARAARARGSLEQLRSRLPAGAAMHVPGLGADLSAVDLTVSTPDDLERFQRFCETHGDSWLEMPTRAIIETMWHAEHPAPRPLRRVA